MRTVLVALVAAFLLSAAFGCAPANNGEYDDYRGGGYEQ